MPRVPTTSFPFLLAAALATAFMPDRATRAGVVLAVEDPQHNGDMAWDGTPEDFAPALDSPAHAIAGNGRSSLRPLGSQRALSFVGISVSILPFNRSDTEYRPDTEHRSFVGLPVSILYLAVFPWTQGCGRRPMCVPECRARRLTLIREIPDQLMGCGTGPSAKGGCRDIDAATMAQDRELLRRARVPHGAHASRTHAGISPSVGVMPESRRWKWAA
jgi:hypothetical protein